METPRTLPQLRPIDTDAFLENVEGHMADAQRSAAPTEHMPAIEAGQHPALPEHATPETLIHPDRVLPPLAKDPVSPEGAERELDNEVAADKDAGMLALESAGIENPENAGKEERFNVIIGSETEHAAKLRAVFDEDVALTAARDAYNRDPRRTARRETFLANGESQEAIAINNYLTQVRDFRRDLTTIFQRGASSFDGSLAEKYESLMEKSGRVEGKESGFASKREIPKVDFDRMKTDIIYNREIANMLTNDELHLTYMADTFASDFERKGQTSRGIGSAVKLDPEVEAPRGTNDWVKIKNDKYPNEWAVSTILPDGSLLVNRVLSMNSGLYDILKVRIGQVQATK